MEWMDRHQVALYASGLAIGAAVGLAWPTIAHLAEFAIFPVLALVLYVNFLLVPTIVWLLSRIVAHDQVLFVGVLFVLLTPCVDYVIVFAGLAGGDKEKLLVATPLLILGQILMLPLYL
jgi:ACR3 family arsenite efflux pump ArsB